MATGLIPARNDALMRFAFPSGNSSISLVVLSETDTDAPFPDVPATLSRQRQRAYIESQTRQASCRCDSTLPLCGSFGSEDPQCGSGDEVALKVEVVVDGGVHTEEALGGSSRLEALLLALLSSLGLMRILRPIVLP